MKIRTTWLLVALVGISDVRGDEPKTSNASARAIEGTITASGSPLKGARVFLGPADQGLLLTMSASTDERGHFRIEVGELPSANANIRVIVLATGFKLVDVTTKPGNEANFELAAEPWKERVIRLQDPEGKPVSGVEITATIGGSRGVALEQLKSDAEGRCSITTTHGVPIGLSARPKGARPIETQIGVEADEPDKVTLPVLPPIRGRVIDLDGRPVPDVTVGRGIFFESDGGARMAPFAGIENAVTDGKGEFAIAPRLSWRRARDIGESRLSKMQLLSFADPSFRRMAYRVFDPTKANERVEVTLGPSRHLRIPIQLGEIVSTSKMRLSWSVSIVLREDLPALYFVSGSLPLKGGVEQTVLEADLPEGNFQLGVSLIDPDAAGSQALVAGASRALRVQKGERALDVAPLELEVSGYRKLIGKRAPELEATDLDTGQLVKLADFRGKVVVLDFWGYWCGPCNLSMPHLMDLHRQFAGRPLAIVALHDQSAQTRAEYERRIAQVRERLWDGRNLPFQVLLDRPDPKRPEDRRTEASGATIRIYGIWAFPTLFVIDTDGTIVEQVPHAQHDRLESLVRKLVEKAERK